jgi:hypothetical protein
MLTNEDEVSIAAVVAKAIREANEAAAVGAERVNSVHCKVRWRRRLMFVAVMVGGAWALGDFAHFEAAHEGWKIGLDGLVACIIEKVCFGIAEA